MLAGFVALGRLTVLAKVVVFAVTLFEQRTAVMEPAGLLTCAVSREEHESSS